MDTIALAATAGAGEGRLSSAVISQHNASLLVITFEEKISTEKNKYSILTRFGEKVYISTVCIFK